MATSDKLDEIKKQSSCQVCGDGASTINYGALSCLSCRTFFRRNAFPNKENPTCRFNGHCEVNMLTRKVCTACRLAKCLAIGMERDLIRKEDLSRTKRKANGEKRPVITIPQQSALDLPNGNTRSDLNASDRTLISNVIHAFDTFNSVSEVRQMLINLNTSASNLQYDVSRSLRLMSSFYNSLQLFISSIPDFKVLTPSEQCSLFQRNMLGLFCIGQMYFMHQSGIFDKPENEMLVLPFYGTEVTQQVKQICQQFNCDPILFKLMLVALAFSSNCYMIQNFRNLRRDSLLLGTFRLLGSQNVYIELIWKYLMHRYDYNESIQRFSTLVKQVLDTLKFSIDLCDKNKFYQAFIDGTMEKIETSLIVNENVIVPLWGKKSS